MNAVMRAGTRVVKEGTNRYRVELIEIVGGSGGRNAVFATGAAFAVTRGADHFQVFARLVAAGSPSSAGGDVNLRLLAGGEIGFLWEASARANVTFYLGPGAAVHYLRFEGKTMDGTMPGTPVGPTLLSFELRAGVRFLRFYGFDVDLFAQANVPLWTSSDSDHPTTRVVDGYTPYGIVGLGVGF
jgi:hypothetical protein